MTAGPALRPSARSGADGSARREPGAFDVCGPLPEGTTVLEASAGSGKTYTIAALTARYVATGRAELSQLMLVTFGRMATSELRARVWERLVSVERALARALAGRSDQGEADVIERLLTTGDRGELDLRRRNVRRALADFDAATIATTHEFCLQMLDGLGVLGDADPQRRVVEEIGDLTREVAGDVFLRRYADAGAPLPYPEALTLATEVVSAAHARLVPHPPAASERAAPSLVADE